MTDRELLEAAARAAGYEYAKHGGYIVVDGIPGNWNPLTDDGDRYRLARDLGLILDFGEKEARFYTKDVWSPTYFPFEENGGEAYAIVRAAAALTRMESKEE